MFVLSRTTRHSVADGEDGVHRLRLVSPLDAEEKNLEVSFEGDAEVPVQHLEMLERIRIAAGWTS